MLSANLTDYFLLGLVGQGQFAQVYCAVHRHTGRVLAIKQTRHVRQQTSQEAFIFPKLAHPNIVECYAIVRTDNNYRFVLEYCESGTLRNYLDTYGALPLSLAKSLLTGILEGLSHMHSKEIVHGDLKPENILLTLSSKGLVAKLSDFGNAQCHAGSQPINPSSLDIGSPTYAAPERFEGQFSYATDLYSVGIMLYEMLLGDRPFSGSPQALRDAHAHQPVSIPTHLSKSAAQIFHTALHKDASQRYSSACSMRDAVQQLSTLFEPFKLQRSRPGNPLTTLSQSSFEQAIAPFNHAHNKPVNHADTVVFNQRSALNSSPQVSHSPQAKTLAVIALDQRYRLRIQTTQQTAQTFLDCFTRRGQFIGQYKLNLELKQVAPTRRPYQLIACPKAIDINGSSHQHSAVLITLKPLQVRYLPCPSPPCCASATTWGYVVACQDTMLFFDRSSNLLGSVKHALNVSQMAALTPHQILLHTPNSTSSPLQLLNLDQLGLEIIF
ncbi:MAG: serine/threonine-protein kinase [Cyanobacteria bacterium P01_D01_bin.105]